MAQSVTLSQAIGSTIDFTDRLPAGSYITRVEVYITATVTPVSFPAGGYAWWIRGQVTTDKESWLSDQVKASSWPFTLPVPIIAVSKLWVQVDPLFQAATAYDVNITRFGATVYFEPSALTLPAAMPF